PAAVDLDDAVTLPTAWSTAWHATYCVGAARTGDWVVVHAAASAVSVAALQLARRVGARVVAVASSPAKVALAADLGADLALRADEDVVARVREVTDGRGADLVLDHIGAATWRTSVDCLRPGGRLVTFGNIGGDQVSLSLAEIYHRGLRLLGAGAYCPADFTAMIAAYGQGGLRTLRAAEYPLEDLPEAYRAQESRTAIGKIVVRP
ncbi:quinone oxidoreductase family protein, partial [Micromonospora echinofusca]